MPAMPGDSSAQLFAFIEEQEIVASKLTAVLETSAADRDRVCELLRSLGYKPVCCELSEGLVISPQKGACFDPMVESLDCDGSQFSHDVQALRRADGTDVPLLLIVRGVQLRIGAISASAANADFIRASCNPSELEARLTELRNSVSPEEGDEGFRCGGYHFNPISRTVNFQGKRVRLKPLEFDLACQFFLNPGCVHPRQTLLRSVWGQIWFDSKTRTLDVHVSSLRKKLDLGPHRRCELVVVRSVGYRLKIYSSEGQSKVRMKSDFRTATTAARKST
jgi:DNA-binding response OmpR family regulator